MDKKILIALISLAAPFLMAESDLYDRISLAIRTSDVIRTKNLVRQLDNLDLTSKEKKKALRTFKRQATEVVESHPSLRVVKSFRDTYNVLLPSIGLGFGALNLFGTLLASEEDFPEEEKGNIGFFKLRNFIGGGFGMAFLAYHFKKGWNCYHQRKTYDKALRIEKWLREEIEGSRETVKLSGTD